LAYPLRLSRLATLVPAGLVPQIAAKTRKPFIVACK